MPVIKVVPPVTQATLIKRPRTASPDIGPSGAPNYEQLRMRRHRSYTSEETLADADIKSVGAVVMGRACTLRDQVRQSFYHFYRRKPIKFGYMVL